LTHAEVRAEIRTRHIISGAQARTELDWSNPDGCQKCRPALNYYAISTFPAEAIDDNQSRFINERAHANIQRDGTFSVIPRMWGGLTNARELRAIADVVEKYNIPTVKVTGGQRIDLLGVKKEDLTRVWRDLREQGGLVSGHAYGKALRTVKTCVGKEWCRFGLQESTRLGVELERMTWGTWTPHKVKMAVSGCPRNCAEASIKDFGVICLESGYELQIAGNGGVKLRATDILCRVSTPDEVKEYCCAYLQIYREEAYYLERTAHWVERVGLDYVKQRVVDDAEGRRAACERFLESQCYVQTDPWAERSEPTSAAGEYIPLKQVV
jgi:nitrite reductase (NADH) large subunit